VRNRLSHWFVFAVIFAIAIRLAPAQDTSNDELVSLIVSLLHESDKDLRSVAFEQVRSEAPGAAATEKFAAELPKLKPDAQVGLLAALASRGDPAARPLVLETLNATKDEAVSVASVTALGVLGEASNVPVLVEKLKAEAKPLAAAARASLVRLPGDQTAPMILTAMDGAAPEVQVALIEILTERRALGAIPELLTAADGDDKQVRTAVIKALGQIAAAEHVAGMVQGVLKAEPGPERDAAEKAVMFVCQRAQNPEERAAPLLEAIHGLSAADQLAMLSTLGRVGGDGARKAIEAAIGESATHTAGIRALCNWPDATIANRLMELSKSDAHPEHRIATLRALIRVAPLADSRSDAERLELLKQCLTICTRDEDRLLVLQRARSIRTVGTLRFVLEHVDEPAFTETACETIVELAHHRALRDAHKEEFHTALDRVIATSKDATSVERANRYKNNQTWVRPKTSAN